MTKNEMELRIKNLEESVATLTAKTYNREVSNENKTNSVESNVIQHTEDIELHSECLDEVAEIITTDEGDIELQSECLDESAECISDLYEQIDALWSAIDK